MSDDQTRDHSPSDADPADTPAAGAPDVPGYAVERVLGEGGMGVVYLARQVSLSRPVALKMIRAGGGGSDSGGAAGRFLREAEAVAALGHPYIVQVYDFGHHAGQPFMALEYVAGGSLQERLRAGPLGVEEAARLVQRVAEAMASAHARGIVHRDLKPANILLAADGSPKVSDFGLVKRLGDETPELVGAAADFDPAEVARTVTGAVLGTPAYMAPEQVRGEASGPAADVYALGVVLFECLTGGRPFSGKTIVELWDAVANRPPPDVRRLRRDAPKPLAAICAKCLRKEPERRYADARGVADDLGRLLRGAEREVEASRREGRFGPLLDWLERHWLLALSGGALGVLMLALFWRSFWNSREYLLTAMASAAAPFVLPVRRVAWAYGAAVVLYTSAAFAPGSVWGPLADLLPMGVGILPIALACRVASRRLGRSPWRIFAFIWLTAVLEGVVFGLLFGMATNWLRANGWLGASVVTWSWNVFAPPLAALSGAWLAGYAYRARPFQKTADFVARRAAVACDPSTARGRVRLTTLLLLAAAGCVLLSLGTEAGYVWGAIVTLTAVAGVWGANLWRGTPLDPRRD